MRELTDFEMEELIDNLLKNDTRVDPSEINVQVRHGVAYLSGVVDSAAERHAAQQDVQSAAEVEGVVDHLTLRNYIERSDEELKQAVRNRLIRDPYVEADRVYVEARSGVVTLRGLVASGTERSAAEDAAWWTPGVTDVVSRLEVEAGGGSPDDEGR